jgi:predicted glycosyltransferase/nucleoside-diphosphate-sugar epimerase
MRCLVTGAAGFVGSHLAERLVQLGHDVVGVESFNPYYDPAIKRGNVAVLRGHPGFQLVEADLTETDLDPLVDGVDWVFHLAGQPGVRGSWGTQFAEYLRHNVRATQRLLEALRAHPPQRLIYASSSSIYGDVLVPMREEARPQPVSPYGVTKLAGEHLVDVYRKSYGVPSVVLRFFTVYGPRQRPDMAFHRFIRAIADGEPVHLYGDGRQTRDFTYVDDVVEACLRAATCSGGIGEVINVGGGASVTVNDVLALLGELIGQPVRVEQQVGPRGDAPHTSAATDRAQSLLEWRPRIALTEGLRRQAEWQLGAGALRGRSTAVTAVRSRHESARLLIYGHDTYGLGHLRRNLTIAAGLTRERPDLSILLLTGSPAVQHFTLPPNVDYVKLPAVVKIADEDYHARTLRMPPAEIVRMRAALVRETVANFAPDVMLVDHAPIGMKGELLPALRELRRTRPEARVVLGLRDIIDEPQRVRATWAEHGIYHALEYFYDAILVYGVPEVMDVVAAYHLPPPVAAKTQYCGYLPRMQSSVPAATARAAFCAQDERLVLVTAGGGGDGYPLLRAYLAGLDTPEAPERVASVIVTGPFMPAAERAELEAQATRRERVHLMEFTHDILGLMQAADLVVCMGGYNTLCEVLSVRARAVVVPRAAPRMEQLLRTSAFEQLGLVSMLQPDALAPATLARRVADVLGEAASGSRAGASAGLVAFMASGALGGLDATTGAVAELLDQAIPAKALVQ